ncbi:hypothetical protein BRARA_D01552 [Brassica rapa]|uniref:Uncharacterized protein n=1 Tax=Brassica campestris TaxID=3711 RepID=A0A397ZL86_BRACM|nr:hypothetical protein BRARA_D01552 [Brassica rapa]
MKSGVLFATLLVIFMSCVSNIFAKSSSEDKTDISSQAPSPQLDIQIQNQVLHDEKIKPHAANNPLEFCQECAHHCIRKKRFMLDCRRLACYCDSGCQNGSWPMD